MEKILLSGKCNLSIISIPRDFCIVGNILFLYAEGPKRFIKTYIREKKNIKSIIVAAGDNPSQYIAAIEKIIKDNKKIPILILHSAQKCFIKDWNQQVTLITGSSDDFCIKILNFLGEKDEKHIQYLYEKVFGKKSTYDNKLKNLRKD